MSVKFQADLDSKNFENQLKIFSSSLGGIFKELMAEVGKEMVADTKARVTFQNRTGKLFNAINFISTDNGGILTTRKNLNKSNVRYARYVESERYIKAKKGKYITFKIDGQWKKVESVRIKARPFMKPTFEEFWEGNNGKGYKALQDALQKKMEGYLS
jgi:hypothetical protein